MSCSIGHCKAALNKGLDRKYLDDDFPAVRGLRTKRVCAGDGRL